LCARSFGGDIAGPKSLNGLGMQAFGQIETSDNEGLDGTV